MFSCSVCAYLPQWWLPLLFQGLHVSEVSYSFRGYARQSTWETLDCAPLTQKAWKAGVRLDKGLFSCHSGDLSPFLASSLTASSYAHLVWPLYRVDYNFCVVKGSGLCYGSFKYLPLFILFRCMSYGWLTSSFVNFYYFIKKTADLELPIRSLKQKRYLFFTEP